MERGQGKNRGFQAESTWLHASTRAGSSFQLRRGQHPPCCLAPRFLHSTTAPLPQPHSFESELSVLPPHTPVTRQCSQTLTPFGRLVSSTFSLSQRSSLLKIVPLLLCSSPSGNYCFDARVFFFWHHTVNNIQALFCNYQGGSF